MISIAYRRQTRRLQLMASPFESASPCLSLSLSPALLIPYDSVAFEESSCTKRTGCLRVEMGGGSSQLVPWRIG